jgi:hypothetical protein
MTSCSALEPIPTVYHTPGTILMSPGCGETYEVLSYPVCRLYEDTSVDFDRNGTYEGKKFLVRFQPNSFEYRSNKKKDQGNYLSYMVRHVNVKSKREFYITDQCLKISKIKVTL